LGLSGIAISTKPAENPEIAESPARVGLPACWRGCGGKSALLRPLRYSPARLFYLRHLRHLRSSCEYKDLGPRRSLRRCCGDCPSALGVEGSKPPHRGTRPPEKSHHQRQAARGSGALRASSWSSAWAIAARTSDDVSSLVAQGPLRVRAHGTTANHVHLLGISAATTPQLGAFGHIPKLRRVFPKASYQSAHGTSTKDCKAKAAAANA
jgi:hypothetical protein